MQLRHWRGLLGSVLAVLVLTQALSGLLRDQLSGAVFQVVHQGGGIVLVAAIALHVVLNVAWVRTTYRPGKRRT